MEDLQTLAGLIGATLVVTGSGLLDEVRDWLLGFNVPLNPLRLLGVAMSSTMAVGFCAGAIYASATGHAVPVIAGGVVAIAAEAADATLATAHGIARRLMPLRVPQPMPMLSPQESGIETDEGRVPTEGDVHAEMDRREKEEFRAHGVEPP